MLVGHGPHGGLRSLAQSDLRVYTPFMATPCYCSLLRTAARRISAHYDEALAPVGVNIAQFRLLRAVERRAPVSLSELSEAVDLDRSTVGRNVRILQRMELVTAAKGEDLRELVLSLSPDGRHVLSEGAPLWEAAQARIEAKLGGEAVESLKAALASL